MKLTVLGLVADQHQLDSIVDALRASGFSSSDISILMPEKVKLIDLGHETNSKAPEGTAAGAATGALVGGALGWLTGFGTLVIPGLGPLVMAGPIVAALGGVGVGSAIGGITGGLIGLGIPEYEATQYESKLAEGKLLIAVHTEDEEIAERAKDILEAFSAKDVICTTQMLVKTNAQL